MNEKYVDISKGSMYNIIAQVIQGLGCTSFSIKTGEGAITPFSIPTALFSFISILQLEAIDAYGVRNCLFDEKLTAYNCCSSMPCPYHSATFIYPNAELT